MKTPQGQLGPKSFRHEKVMFVSTQIETLFPSTSIKVQNGYIVHGCDATEAAHSFLSRLKIIKRVA